MIYLIPKTKIVISVENAAHQKEFLQIQGGRHIIPFGKERKARLANKNVRKVNKKCVKIKTVLKD